MSDFVGMALCGIVSSLFARCDQCRSRAACECACRCQIIDGIHKPSAAFIDYPHDWRRDAERLKGA